MFTFLEQTNLCEILCLLIFIFMALQTSNKINFKQINSMNLFNNQISKKTFGDVYGILYTLNIRKAVSDKNPFLVNKHACLLHHVYIEARDCNGARFPGKTVVIAP